MSEEKSLWNSSVINVVELTWDIFYVLGIFVSYHYEQYPQEKNTYDRSNLHLSKSYFLEYLLQPSVSMTYFPYLLSVTITEH